MKVAVLFFALTASTLNVVHTIPLEINRIVNGKPADVGQLPYQVLLVINLPGLRKAVCGGSLIDTKWVLTAAHCAVDALSFQVHLGAHSYKNINESGRVIIQSSEKIVHTKYNPSALANDLALIKLPQSVILSKTIQIIALPFN